MTDWVQVTQIVPAPNVGDANAHAQATGTDADAGTYGRGIIWDHPNLPLECHLSNQLIAREDVERMQAGELPPVLNENADATKAQAHLNRRVIWEPLKEGSTKPTLAGTKIFMLILPSGVSPLPYLEELGLKRRESATV